MYCYCNHIYSTIFFFRLTTRIPDACLLTRMENGFFDVRLLAKCGGRVLQMLPHAVVSVGAMF